MLTRSSHSDRNLADERTAFPEHLRRIWDQHLCLTTETSPQDFGFSSLGTLILRQSTGNQVTDCTLGMGSYEAVIGVAASESALLTLGGKYGVRLEDLADFRNTHNAAPQTIPCRTVEGQRVPIDQKDLSAPSKQRFTAAVQKYTKNGLSPAIMRTWTEWRIQEASIQYESRKIWEASIPKPSDQRKEFTTFQTALHRVMRGLESDVLAPRLAKDSSTKAVIPTAPGQLPLTLDSLPREAFYEAYIAVSKHVLQHLLRESAKVERRLRATRAASGAPKQPERQALISEIVRRLGEFGSASVQTKEKDAKEICVALGVQGRFNAVDERLSSGSKTKAQSASTRRSRPPLKRPTTGK